MAEFSKQWVLKQDPQSTMWDFDILEIANSLSNEYYTPQICEGFGFIAIAKDEYGGINLAFRNDENELYWVEYNKLINNE